MWPYGDGVAPTRTLAGPYPPIKTKLIFSVTALVAVLVADFVRLDTAVVAVIMIGIIAHAVMDPVVNSWDSLSAVGCIFVIYGQVIVIGVEVGMILIVTGAVGAVTIGKAFTDHRKQKTADMPPAYAAIFLGQGANPHAELVDDA